MMTYRDRLELEANRIKHPAANDDESLPPAWLTVAILLGYVGVIGIVVWALVGVVR